MMAGFKMKVLFFESSRTVGTDFLNIYFLE